MFYSKVLNFHQQITYPCSATERSYAFLVYLFVIYDNQIEFFFLQKSSIPFTQVRLAAQAREASSISYIIKPTFTGFIQFYIRILKPV